MNLTPELADMISARYDVSLPHALRSLFSKHGLAALTDDARRELILDLGADRRFSNRLNQRNLDLHKARSLKIAAE